MLFSTNRAISICKQATHRWHFMTLTETGKRSDTLWWHQVGACERRLAAFGPLQHCFAYIGAFIIVGDSRLGRESTQWCRSLIGELPLSLAVVRSRSLQGLTAPPVIVEVHLANGLPSFTLVGLADTEVKEARERVRAALANSGFEFPFNKRITVNLAPADLPKASGRFDLPIAVGILAAMGQIPSAWLDSHEFVGELSLGGELRPIRGALAMALSLQQLAATGALTLVLPKANAAEAALVEGLAIKGVSQLRELIDAMQSQAPSALLMPPTDADELSCTHHLDLLDVKGQGAAKRALEVSAAGGHNMLMVGPPGTGKSMLAQRLSSLLPVLSNQEALAAAAVRSLDGPCDLSAWRQRVVRAPHHTASSVALVGGGSPPRPGEISMAHFGILFLDELPQFSRPALEALREPLETGCITISRAARRHDFPAKFQLIAAMNPCPCGYLGHPTRACRCSPEQVARYHGKLSGPLLDRIDIHVEVPAVPPEVLSQAAHGERSAVVAQRVQLARHRQMKRQGCLNQALQGQALDDHVGADSAAMVFLQQACVRLSWSNRAFHRVLRLARTLADLEQADKVQMQHMAEAIQYRRVLTQ